MFVRVFEYTAAPGRAEDFETAYGVTGPWVRLFSGAQGYLGSTLERGAGDRYRTQDLWRSAADFNAFLAANQPGYDAVNETCAPLKLVEEHCGHFTETQPAGALWHPVS